MAITGLDHINITTTRLAETRDFFIDVLGLAEGARPPIGVPGHWLYAGDGAVVHLMDKGTTGGDSETAALDHIAFDRRLRRASFAARSAGRTVSRVGRDRRRPAADDGARS